MIVAFTDGGISKGTSCGGASLIEIKGKNDYSVIKSNIKICEESTNNEAELFGIYKALEMLEPNNSEPYLIFSDSEYAVKSLSIWILDWYKSYSYKREHSICIPSMMTKGKTPVKNAKILCMIINTIVDNNLKVRFINVKGHKSPNKNDDIMSQALYFKESNNMKKIISLEFAKFLCTYNEYIDNLVSDCICKFKEGGEDNLLINNTINVDIRYGKMFDDEKYKHLYILNKAIMNKYKKLIGVKSNDY